MFILEGTRHNRPAELDNSLSMWIFLSWSLSAGAMRAVIRLWFGWPGAHIISATHSADRTEARDTVGFGPQTHAPRLPAVIARFSDLLPIKEHHHLSASGLDGQCLPCAVLHWGRETRQHLPHPIVKASQCHTLFGC